MFVQEIHILLSFHIGETIESDSWKYNSEIFLLYIYLFILFLSVTLKFYATSSKLAGSTKYYFFLKILNKLLS